MMFILHRTKLGSGCRISHHPWLQKLLQLVELVFELRLLESHRPITVGDRLRPQGPEAWTYSEPSQGITHQNMVATHWGAIIDLMNHDESCYASLMK